jgi:hypothetical protein
MEKLGGMGTTVNLNIQNLYAEDSVPRKLAEAIDKELTKLRQSGASTFASQIEGR